MKIVVISDPKLISQIESKNPKKTNELENKNNSQEKIKNPLAILQDALNDFDNKVSFFPPKLDEIIHLKPKSYDLIINNADKISTNYHPAQIVGIFDLTQIPYCGSQIDAITICKNKPLFKSLLKLNHIATPKFQILKIQGGKIPEIRKDFKYPLVLKFFNAGIHTHSIKDKVIKNSVELQENLKIFLNKTKNYFALLEEYITGRKFYLPILGNELNNNIRFLPAIETLSSEEDLQANLLADSNLLEKKFLELTDPLVKHARKIAKKAYNFFNCRDYAMAVFILDKNTNNLLLHEINPITSLLPNGKISIAAEHLGILYSEIINDIILATLLRYGFKLKGKYVKKHKNIK